MYSFLSYVASFPTSEAVVETWGSSIDHLNKNKPHAKGVIGLDDTGTIDKLAFVQRNGPPPGFHQNRRLFKSALQLMYKGDFTKDVLHVCGRNLKTTSLVIERIMNSNDNILPCFMDRLICVYKVLSCGNISYFCRLLLGDRIRGLTYFFFHMILCFVHYGSMQEGGLLLKWKTHTHTCITSRGPGGLRGLSPPHTPAALTRPLCRL